MSSNKDWFWPVSIGLGVLLVVGGAGLYWLRGGEPPPAVEETGPPAAAVAPLPPPAPVATPAPPPRTLPLPPLDESDPDVLGGLTEIFGQQAVMEYVTPQRLVRHIVVSIDNSTRGQMALNQRPINPTGGDFVVTGPEDAPVLSPENYARYEPFVAIVNGLDAKTLVALYRSLEPLFQQAYEELGQPDSSFNDRLIEVIDHLLAAPSPRGDIRLVQPSVLYRYADEQLEKSSSGHKLLIRMGPDNAGVIKGKLREIKAELR
jgi:hypothetical protein